MKSLGPVIAADKFKGFSIYVRKIYIWSTEFASSQYANFLSLFSANISWL